MSHETEVVARLQGVIDDQRAEIANLKMQLEVVQAASQGPAASTLDCVGFLSLKYMSNGGLEVSGNIGDEKFALKLLEHAMDSIRAHHRSVSSRLVAPNGVPILAVPNRDVDVQQSAAFPTRPFGDIAPGERGDLPP